MSSESDDNGFSGTPGSIRWVDHELTDRITLLKMLLQAQRDIAWRDGYIERVRDEKCEARIEGSGPPSGMTENDFFAGIETKMRSAPSEDLERMLSRLSTNEIEALIVAKEQRSKR